MDIESMGAALEALEACISELRNAGEDGLAENAINLMEICLARYGAEGGDRSIFDATLF